MPDDVKIKLEGVDETCRILDEMSKEYPKKVIAAGFRTSMKPFSERLKQLSPAANIKNVIKTKVYDKSSSPAVTAGFFGKRYKSSDSGMSPYMVAYWTNYGTLQNRLPGHDFIEKRKRKSAHKKGGIVPRQFVERAWNETKSAVIAAIPVQMQKAAARYLRNCEKHGK